MCCVDCNLPEWISLPLQNEHSSITTSILLNLTTLFSSLILTPYRRFVLYIRPVVILHAWAVCMLVL